MERALSLAERAAALGEVPVGAVLAQEGRIIAEGWNAPISRCDPSAHAEILALRNAGAALGAYRLPGTTLYVTLEPCAMCVGALIHARIARLVYGARDSKTGACGGAIALHDAPCHNHRLEALGGILEERCGALLWAFFRARRMR